MVIVEQLKSFSDARGVVYEPVNVQQMLSQQNCHVAMTEPGCVRGNHYHHLGTEIMVAAGPVLVRYRENGQIKDVSVPENVVFRFVFPPKVTHAIKNTGTRPAAVVAFNTEGHDPSKPDLVRDVILE